ncbi:hypothetical protein DBK40_22820, partial [Salmonella enterica subsp. enterica serovar Typhi]
SNERIDISFEYAGDLFRKEISIRGRL